MHSAEVKKRFLEFFKKRGHAIIPSASLLPENDPSVLFTTAGMQPLVPYLLGEKHPAGKRLVNIQKCVRTVDIEEVGDATHLTFFEMLGNWSLGDYFKEEAIQWSFELLIKDEEGFGLDFDRLYVSVFEGDQNAPKDEEAQKIWQKVGVKKSRIYFRPASENWWSPGDNGPCGPDSEMFYDVTEDGLGDLTPDEFEEADSRGDVVEIWNDVFMQYKKKDGKVIGTLENKNVDTGAGFERLVAVLQGKKNVFETDLFFPILEQIRGVCANIDRRSERIICDHMRSVSFMMADGATPSNTDGGYIVRRLIRRTYRIALFQSGESEAVGLMESLVDVVALKYGDDHPKIREKAGEIKKKLLLEIGKFKETLKDGLKRFEKVSKKDISGDEAFILFSTFGFPIDMTVDLAREKGVEVDLDGFEKACEEHKKVSKKGADKKFKGGLGGSGEQETKYHTVTHLLNASLRQVLGDHVIQKGSNITADRARFDFSHPKKLTDEEKEKIEKLVNEKINDDLEVRCDEMTLKEAYKIGASGVFSDRYSEMVKVYSIIDRDGAVFNRELCGGPHVDRTGDLGRFRIVKEKAVAEGIRRIKAILD